MKTTIVLLLSVFLLAGCRLPAAVAFSRLALLPISSSSSSPAALMLRDRLGGPVMDVAVDSDYAFVGHGFALAILDIRDPTAPQRLAWLPVSANELLIVGDRAYVIGREGLNVFDITQPAAPKLLSFVATANSLAGVSVEGDMIYVVDFQGGFYVIDGANSTAMQVVGELNLAQRSEGLAVNNGYVYVTAYGVVTIIAVHNPARPQPVGALALPSWSQNIVIVDHHAYITGNSSLSIFDLSDPTQPTLRGEVRLGGFIDDLVIAGDYAFVSNGSAGVQVVNIADPTAPQALAAITLPGLTTGMALMNDILYAANLAGNLYMLDTQQPEQPVIAAIYHTPGPTWRTAAAGEFLYLIGGIKGELQIVDATVPTHLKWAGSFATTGDLQHLVVQANYLYLVDEQGILYVLEISDPSQPREVATLILPSLIATMTLAGDTLLLTTRADTLLTIDVTQPSAPHLLEDCTLAAAAHTFATQPEATYFTNDAGFYRFTPNADCGAVYQPLLTMAAAIRQMEIVGNYAYLGVHKQGFAIVDLSDPAAPAVVSITQLGDDVTDLVVQDGYAVVAAGDAGVHVFDIRQPTQPVAVGFYQTPDFARSLAVIDQTIYVGDGFGGLLSVAFAEDWQQSAQVVADARLPPVNAVHGWLRP